MKNLRKSRALHAVVFARATHSRIPQGGAAARCRSLCQRTPRSALAFATVASFASLIASAKQPNVLFIAVDDLRPELGCYGASYIKSPNIDRLAAQGMVFERAYCQYAICGPTRASLLTGLRPDTLRIEDIDTYFRNTVPDVVTLPQYFKQNGYTALYFGKVFHNKQEDRELSWSNGNEIPNSKSRNSKANQRGQPASGGGGEYQLPESREIIQKRRADAVARYGSDPAKTEGLLAGPAWEAADKPDNAYTDGRTTDSALATLRTLAAAQRAATGNLAPPDTAPAPFFLAVGYHKPHLPFVAPKKYFDLYPPGSVPLVPADVARPPENAPTLARHSSFELRTRHGIPLSGPIDDALARDLRRAYAACVSFIDAQVGRLLDELDRLGLSDDTIVVLWGDHGWHLGEYGIWGKATDYEVATRVPLIVRAPHSIRNPQSEIRNSHTRALVEFVDIYPTLCELAGLPVSPRLEGRSFAPILSDPQLPGKPAAFSQFPTPALREWAARPLSPAMRGTFFGPLIAGVEAQLKREHGARYEQELFNKHVTGYSMRTDRYRYTAWVDRRDPQGEPLAVELYDHERDPGETRNIAALPENAALVAQLRAQWLAGVTGAKKRGRCREAEKRSGGLQPPQAAAS